MRRRGPPRGDGHGSSVRGTAAACGGGDDDGVDLDLLADLVGCHSRGRHLSGFLPRRVQNPDGEMRDQTMVLEEPSRERIYSTASDLFRKGSSTCAQFNGPWFSEGTPLERSWVLRQGDSRVLPSMQHSDVLWAASTHISRQLYSTHIILTVRT